MVERPARDELAALHEMSTLARAFGPPSILTNESAGSIIVAYALRPMGRGNTIPFALIRPGEAARKKDEEHYEST